VTAVTSPRRTTRTQPPIAAERGTGWLLLTAAIVPLAILGSAANLLDGGSYAEETSNWAAQAAGQDIANLIVFPIMALLAALAWRGSLRARLAWTGVAAYSTYSYAIYCFDVHWGRLFLLDVAVFGLSTYALVGGVAGLEHAAVRARFSPAAPVRLVSGALIGVAAAFAALWLSIEVPAAVSGTPADELHKVGLFTNPVHVLDLAIVLPATAIAGVLLRRRRPLGYCLAPLILSMLAALTVGIVSVMLVSAHRDIDPLGPGVAVTTVLLAGELVLLWRFLQAVGPPPEADRRHLI
jgi:hypothetical protein